jgi:hypothetical protein
MAKSEGYAVSKWMDRVLPQNAILLAETPSTALLPRPFVSWDLARMSNLSARPGQACDARLARALYDQNVSAVVMLLPAERSSFKPLIPCFGEKINDWCEEPLCCRGGTCARPFGRSGRLLPGSAQYTAKRKDQIPSNSVNYRAPTGGTPTGICSTIALLEKPKSLPELSNSVCPPAKP